MMSCNRGHQSARWHRFSGVVGLAVIGMIGAPAAWAGQASAQESVTFTKDVASILQRSCQNCHRPGGAGPMSLITYEDVRPWARAIKQVTATREMPPWFIEKHIGIQDFMDDPSLSDAEIAAIARWVDAGAPLGDPSLMPPPRVFGDDADWAFGTPDLIVSSQVKTVEAVAADWYGQLADVPTGLTEDRYVKAVEIKEVRLEETTIERVVGKVAGDLNYFVLHHAHISAASAEKEGPADSSSASDLMRSPFYIVYEVGQNAMFYPDKVGVKLPAGSVLAFWDMHYHSVGKEVPIRVDVGFKFHPVDYKPKYAQAAAQLPMTGVGKDDLDIPGGQNNIRLDGFHVMRQNGLMLTFEPHLHSSGERMCAEAIYPDGRRETLNCAGYNHNWVKAYVYEEDVAPLLPKGTVIHMTAWYDNTRSNPRVVDPRNWKGWGNRSIDDMFFLLPRVVSLTDTEFEAEVEARQAKRRLNASASNRGR